MCNPNFKQLITGVALLCGIITQTLAADLNLLNKNQTYPVGSGNKITYTIQNVSGADMKNFYLSNSLNSPSLPYTVSGLGQVYQATAKIDSATTCPLSLHGAQVFTNGASCQVVINPGTINALGVFSLNVATSYNYVDVNGVAQHKPLSANASKVVIVPSQLYVFGDGFSDISNINLASRYVTLWDTDFANDLGLSITPAMSGGTIYAETGATATTSTGPYYDLAFLMSAFMATHPVADPNALYIIWMGGADLVHYAAPGVPAPNPYESVTVPATNNIMTAVANLQALGAKHIAVINLGNIGILPRLGGSADNLFSALSANFNMYLAQDMTNLNAANPSLPPIDTVDLTPAINNLFTGYQSCGFVNINYPCTALSPNAYCIATSQASAIVPFNHPTLCNGSNIGLSPTAYFFYSPQDPSSAGHKYLSIAIENQLYPGLNSEP